MRFGNPKRLSSELTWGPGLMIPVRERGDVERRFGYIDADVAVHECLRAGYDRRGPTLRDAGSSPQATVRALGDQPQVAPKLTCGLGALRQNGLPP